MRFEETYLNDNILDALYDMRFDEMTPIQERCIPEILDGYDVMGVAQTGTGKTAAYLLPILSQLDDGDYPKDAINCVIMSPTRELAQQIDQAMQGFGYYLDGVSSVAVYGGNDGGRYEQELRGMRLGADILIATPGRLLSHLKVGNLDLSRCSFFVLDEADRMLDMGFIEDILKIVGQLPASCQRVMFSATMPPKIRELAVTLLHNPVEVKIAVSKPAEKIRQSAYVCYEPQKLKIIQHLFKAGDLQRVIIFSGKKEKVKDITRSLKQMHINCDQMHSDLSQQERDEVMYRFKSGKTDVLVATDIVARGIDIDDIRIVINYDVPQSPLSATWTSTVSNRSSTSSARRLRRHPYPTVLVRRLSIQSERKSARIREETGAGTVAETAARTITKRRKTNPPTQSRQHKIQERQTIRFASSFLEIHVAAVASRAHGEVHPDGRSALLEDQLVEVLLLPVRDIQQDTGIAYRLSLILTSDIRRTARQMVRVLRAATSLIHLL